MGATTNAPSESHGWGIGAAAAAICSSVMLLGQVFWAPPISANVATELTPSGVERILPRSNAPHTLVLDGQGDIWGLGDGLMRFSERDGRWEQTGDWSVADDLAFATRAITPAREGGVWLGGSAARHFDGTRFTDVIASPGGEITELVEAPDGDLWVLVDEQPDPWASIWHWDGSSWTDTEAYQAGHDLTIDSRGDVWVLESAWEDVWHAWVARYDGTSWHRFSPQVHPMIGDELIDIAATADGRILLTTWGRQPIIFDGTRWRKPKKVPKAEGWAFTATPDGDLWLMSSKGWFVRRADGKVKKLKGGDHADLTVLALPAGEAVFGGDELAIVRDGESTVFWAPPGRPADADLTAGDVVPSDAAVWVNYDGLWRCPAPTTDASEGCQRSGKGLPKGEGHVLARSSDGTMWATSDRGTAQFDGRRWRIVDKAPSSIIATGPDGTVWTLQPDHEDRLLTEWTLSDADWRPVHHDVPDWLGGGGFGMSILPAGDGSAWIAGGWPFKLAHFDGETWTEVTSIAGEEIRGAFSGDVGVDGTIWVSGFYPEDEEGHSAPWLARLDGETWTALELPAEPLLTPLLGPDGAAWFGGDGLWRFDGTDASQVALGGLRVSPVAVFDHGEIWFTVNGQGLYRIAIEPTNEAVRGS